MTGANLTGANFSHANLHEAKLANAQMQNTKMDGAIGPHGRPFAHPGPPKSAQIRAVVEILVRSTTDLH